MESNLLLNKIHTFRNFMPYTHTHLSKKNKFSCYCNFINNKLILFYY